MYQLYAYATRYKCPNSILLYPKGAGVSDKTYHLDAEEAVTLRTCQIDMNMDIRKNRKAFQAELKKVLGMDNVAPEPGANPD